MENGTRRRIISAFFISFFVPAMMVSANVRVRMMPKWELHEESFDDLIKSSGFFQSPGFRQYLKRRWMFGDQKPPPPSDYPHRRPVIESYGHPFELHHPPIPADDHIPSETNHGYHRPREFYDATRDSGESEFHHGYRPHLPSFLQHHTHQSVSTLSNQPTYKMITKANPDYSLAVRNGHVILAHSDPSDDAQHWYKDEKYSTRVKDEEGFPSFALVNKATGQAMKHSIGATHPVQLLAYNPEVLDESVLWTQGKDLGDGFRAVRMINNIQLMVDAFHGDKKSGGVHDGTTIVLWHWNKGDNQRWKIVPY